MRFEEYRRHDALGLAALVASKEVSAAELLETALARAETVNPSLNAIVTPMTEIARERAKQPLTGPFAGVPFLIKDLFQDYAGVPATHGCKALKNANYTPNRNSEIVNRWLNSGAVIFGRTHSAEFGSKAVTETDAWGITRNPWNLERTPGGSSGGSAAAVAAGIVPMAGANDGGGSIRIPAATTGLFGLKPGRGRTPWGPTYSEYMHGGAMTHVISRSVRDSAAMLDATHGPEQGSTCHLAPPDRPYLEEVARTPAKLRIGFTVKSPIGTEVHPEAIRAVREAAQLLESLGHTVEEAEPQFDGLRMAIDYATMWVSQCAASVDEVRRLTGCGRSGFENDMVITAALGRSVPGTKYVDSYRRMSVYGNSLAEFHRTYDLFLTPTLAHPPIRIGQLNWPLAKRIALNITAELGLSGLAFRFAERELIADLFWMPHTPLANVTGLPAMSVPLHWTEDGLPMGVQFIGPPSSEGLLFQVAGQLEQVKPWFDRVPPLA